MRGSKGFRPLRDRAGMAGTADVGVRGCPPPSPANPLPASGERGSGQHPGPAERPILPALRASGPPVRGIDDMTASLNALLAKPHERSERARQVLAQQPMLAQHPLVSGSLPEFTPHRPPRPEKSEGGIAFKIVSEYAPKGDQPTAIADAGGGREPARAQPGAARRHRLGQDLHHGAGDRPHPAPGPDPGAQQDAGGAALRRVQGASSPTTRSSTSSPTTTTTSPKPTCRAPTPTSRRNRR